MTRTLFACVSGILFCVPAFASVAAAEPEALSLQLTLAPAPAPATQPSAEATPLFSPDDVSDEAYLKRFPKSLLSAGRHSRGGIGAESVYDNNTALAYRTQLGLGLGVATNASWALTQSVPLGQGLNLSVYYLRGMDSFVPALDRTLPLPSDPPGTRAVGVKLQWKF